jgi:hypothetical protein
MMNRAFGSKLRFSFNIRDCLEATPNRYFVLEESDI